MRLVKRQFSVYHRVWVKWYMDRVGYVDTNETDCMNECLSMDMVTSIAKLLSLGWVY